MTVSSSVLDEEKSESFTLKYCNFRFQQAFPYTRKLDLAINHVSKEVQLRRKPISSPVFRRRPPSQGNPALLSISPQDSR